MIAISLLAAQLAAAAAPAAGQPQTSRVSASAQATVRILPAARVSLGGDAQPEGHKVVDARVTVEDGSRRAARLVEFQ